MGSKWCIYRLGDIAEFSYGKMPKKEFVGTGDYVIFSGYKYTESYPEKNTSAGELIVVARGVGGTGDVKITTRDCYLTNLSIKINLDETKVRKEYFYYLFLQSNLRYLDSGSAQSQITINDLANVEISAPSLNVQDLIVKSLKAFDDKITTLSSMNQTLEQMSQTLFKSWFVDFDPVIDNALDAGNPIPEALQTRAELRQKVRNSVDFKPLSAEIRSLFPSEFEETELGWVPKGWSFTALKNFGKIICGKTPTKSNKNYYGEDFLFIKIPDMHGKVFVTNSHDKLSKLGSESQSNKIIPHGSICVSCIATVGLVSINAQDCHTNQQINSIVPNSPHYRNYLYFSMLEKYKIFHDLASGGSATLNMNTSVFSNIATLMPNNLVLKQFHKITEPWFEAILLNEYKLTSLASLRDTLLPKLISGELSLEDLPDLTTNTEAA
ncbi:TPA: restriction endonuclease subunit S [Escherichia coli]|nr:restriction endonuclease subunit S [Escherichia coli]EKL8228614.1 restriction endonuclease subunit S [Escherichia coli]MCV8388975.1 restriction endonuclease subunit S [Escherichia coli]HAH2503100.1 restriction endonuclease subunit S [Escherichia coli]HAH2515353.1 restriction endonuclease subunit S [Escherichia coli]